jgi:predicted TIM-barrel fold metal-dependent hydrolase
MNVPVRQPVAVQRLKVVDCDIHPAYATPTALFEFLPQRWRDHWSTFGAFFRPPLIGQLPFPRMAAGGMRTDSFPRNGSPPGADLDLMRTQHLDANGVEVGMLIALSRGGMEERNLDFAAALSTAANDWQKHTWCEPEPRLRAAIVVPQEHTEHAVGEIERRSSDPAFVQVLMSPRAADPLGNRRYWPIYAAAEAHNKPVALHVAGFSGGHSSTPTGWPTYYMQEHYAQATGMQSTLASLVFEGVFERFPRLKIALIEGGFAWAPALCWRMDKAWERMRAEVPHLKRPPSEYVREHVWFTTQPIDEPDKPEHLVDVMGWLGWDRLMFSTDYPHWDFDDPAQALAKLKLTGRQKSMLLRDNARALYGLA